MKDFQKYGIKGMINIFINNFELLPRKLIKYIF